MSELSPLDEAGKPRLKRGVRLTHAAAHGGWVILAPERVLKTDDIGAEILKRCTGEATLAAVIDDLSATFGAPRERVAADVHGFLSGLLRDGHLELRA
jgi:pyrroloquinoline quinone biosynthesis protein D